MCRNRRKKVVVENRTSRSNTVYHPLGPRAGKDDLFAPRSPRGQVYVWRLWRVAGAPCKGFNAQPLVELSLGWTAAIMLSYSMYVDLRYRHAWVRTSEGGIFFPIRGVH